jgi:hypothetical protein
MWWSDCITYKSSFWNNEVIVKVLKSDKKIGQYNRKIGIGIGSSEGRNFAHLCQWPPTTAQNNVQDLQATYNSSVLIIHIPPTQFVASSCLHSFLFGRSSHPGIPCGSLRCYLELALCGHHTHKWHIHTLQYVAMGHAFYHWGPLKGLQSPS